MLMVIGDVVVSQSTEHVFFVFLFVGLPAVSATAQ